MIGVEWWLLVVAFLLGAALTTAFTVRRVRREVPVTGTRMSAGAAILEGETPTD